MSDVNDIPVENKNCRVEGVEIPGKLYSMTSDSADAHIRNYHKTESSIRHIFG